MICLSWYLTIWPITAYYVSKDLIRTSLCAIIVHPYHKYHLPGFHKATCLQAIHVKSADEPTDVENDSVPANSSCFIGPLQRLLLAEKQRKVLVSCCHNSSHFPLYSAHNIHFSCHHQAPLHHHCHKTKI